MAYQFTAASSQYLSCPTTSANVPLTIACWVYPTILGIATTQFYVEFGPTSSPTNRFGIGNANNSSAFRVTVANNTTNAQANTTALLSLNNWNHVAGVFSSSASRTAYLNGGNAVTNTTSLAINASNTVRIAAAQGATTISNYANGHITDVGVWNAALTQAEVVSLAKGMTCNKVRPQNLVFYAPLIRDLQDVKGGLSITNNNGATVANHPRIYA